MLANRSGLLFLERYVPASDPASGFSVQDVATRYRGFDGVVWPGGMLRDIPLHRGLAPVAVLSDLLAYWNGVDDQRYDLLSFGEDADLPGFDFLGFDLGYYESEYHHFSVVLNEVICGINPELVSISRTLNRNLLLSSEPAAEELVLRRVALARSGADLEVGDETIEVIPVYGVRRSDR